ncbi:DUF6087 family protein [Streptomyces sp. NPDC047017]|uniref:DUF6087 family protein n=1 Tax=Streptomyces sp. NPDC047017 TaxID=3155024 RepID=UPI0034057AEB
MDDEPLDKWAQHREERRPAPGERRATPLDRPQRGGHVDPGGSRGLQEWDGHRWVPVGVAEDRAAAAAEVGQDGNARAARVPLPTSGKLPPLSAPYRPTIPFHRP